MGWKDLFTKNLHVTTPEDPDPFFRPRHYSEPKGPVVKAALEAIAGLSRWKVVEHRENQGRIRASVAAKFLPFADDVDIYVVQGLDGVTKLEIISRAQGGRGDFGRNKKNVRDFLSSLDAKLPPKAP
ncbi:MAG TPA: DUF1499 domain-containing protein [bacterium]|nr:DUF1499 domain-containing protein [bacterium]